jgi:hypothetical protein
MHEKLKVCGDEKIKGVRVGWPENFFEFLNKFFLFILCKKLLTF